MFTSVSLAKSIYENRAAKAREIKRENNHIIGYVSQVPIELITAAGLVPYRIIGDPKTPLKVVDSYLETIVCPVVRNQLDAALQSKNDFLDGLVVPHECDNIGKFYDLWRYYLKFPYCHFINVPHVISIPAKDFMKAEILTFKRSLEEYIGKTISNEQIIHAINLHNVNRLLLRQIYAINKSNTPVLSAMEITMVLVAAATLPALKSSELLRNIIAEIDQEKRQDSTKKLCRLLLYGAGLDDVSFIQLVEDAGAIPIVDDLYIGTRSFNSDINENIEPIGALAEYYLEQVYSHRVLKPTIIMSHTDDLDVRFRHIRDVTQQYAVDGVIYYTPRYCDILDFDEPDVKEYLNNAGIPAIQISHSYNVSELAKMRTIIETFVTMLSANGGRSASE